jgi:hypothetical protein
MADFKSAISQGLKGAENLELQRAEIRDVLNDLSTQVKEATGGKVRVAVEAIPLNEVADWSFSARGLMAVTAEKPVKYRVLCSWEQPKSGYPCVLEIGRMRFSCEDKVALVGALEELLRTPETGERIRALMG